MSRSILLGCGARARLPATSWLTGQVRMCAQLAALGAAAYPHVLQRPAEDALRMAFEMADHNHRVQFCELPAHVAVLQEYAVGDLHPDVVEAKLTIAYPDGATHHLLGEAVPGSGPQVVGSGKAGGEVAESHGIAVHDRRLAADPGNLIHDGLHELGAKVHSVAVLTHVDLDSHRVAGLEQFPEARILE
jgi:hypothetical protein